VVNVYSEAADKEQYLAYICLLLQKKYENKQQKKFEYKDV